MAEIALERLTKVYGDGTRAVSDLDLEIADGEFVVLVGPSGCGKTSALRMIAGLEPITEGRVVIGGEVVNDLPPKDRDIAMIFQNYALYPHMSAFDNMAFGLKLRKVPREERTSRVQRTATMLGLPEVLRKRPKALSGGQRQRVAMGRAIVREPRAFLMDEPLSNLDAKLRVQMRAEIRRIQTELATTTIFVTHDQTEAMTMGDRVAVMKKGVLQQVDTPQALYDRPANLFVAGFIGSPAMNLVDAALMRSDGRVVARFGPTELAMEDAFVETHPQIKGYEGGRVVLGIRPETIEHEKFSALQPDGRRLNATVDLRESLGSDALVRFKVDAPPVVTEDTVELVKDVEDVDEIDEAVEDRASVFVAKIDARADARAGESVALVVDTSRVHVFDPKDGRAIA